MLYLIDPGLDVSTARGLNKYQTRVDSERTHAERVKKGKALFKRYNRQENRVFGVVRERLATMCAGARRCGYCEDSVGDEVEHIRPKDLYPEVVFVWENYLLACGPCNGGKNNRFSVIRGGRLIDVRCPSPAVATTRSADRKVARRRRSIHAARILFRFSTSRSWRLSGSSPGTACPESTNYERNTRSNF